MKPSLGDLSAILALTTTLSLAQGAPAGRLNTPENGYLRVHLNEPRSYRVTASVEF